MESVRVEIRPMGDLPQTINVPLYVPLAAKRAEVARLRAAVDDCQSRVDGLTNEFVMLSRATDEPTADDQIFERLQQVTREREQLENELAAADVYHKRADDELSQWLYQFAWNLYRRRLLTREMSEAARGPVMRAFAPGEKRQRNKLEVLGELEECCRWLAAFSGDESLIETSAALKNAIG